VNSLEEKLRDRWIWWALPCPASAACALDDLIDFERATVNWHTPEETAKMLAMMSPANCVKVENAKAYRKRIVGTVYKRVRTEGGRKFQRAEVRFDQISGCLRTPAGGSSRQTILVVEGGSVRSRLMTPREASRLMGLPESYRLPENFNDGYHLAGDGVVVPVVRYLAQHLLNPLALQLPNRRKEAA
jgi:DNA (cytosine-5)-methyltransferase 1